MEANGPRLADMVPALREILDRSRLVLYLDACMDELPSVLGQLPTEGLYLMVSDKFVRNEEEFRRLLALSGDRHGRITR